MEAAIAAAGRIVQGERTANKERYARVNSAWPSNTPPMTFDEGRIAAKKLWRIGTGKEWPKTKNWSGKGPKWIDVYQIKPTSGNRWTQFYSGVLYINPAKGWDDLVHTISHRTWDRTKPKGHAGHGTGHASHEYMLIQEVINRGWLQGKLKRPEKLLAARDVREVRHQSALARLKQWQTKAKRAATAIKKLKQTISYYEKEALKPKQPKAVVDPQKRVLAAHATRHKKIVELLTAEINDRAEMTNEGKPMGKDEARKWLLDDLEHDEGLEFQDQLKSHGISPSSALSVLKSLN